MTEPSDGKNEISPLVSIITPTYNSDREYLFEAIASVLQQTYPKIEYIITDDGSEHFPEEEVKEFLRVNAGKNIISWTILRHERNIGTVKNVNGALRVSKGKYIFGLAHDDIYYDEKVIEEWVEEFQKSDSKIITGIRSTKNLRTGEEEYLPTQKQRDMIRSYSPQRLFMKILRENIISGASTAYAKCVFEEYGLYDEKCRLLEDWPYYLEVLSKGERITMWEHPVIYYRWGGISTKQNTLSPQLERDFVNTRYKYHQTLKKILPKDYRDVLPYYITWIKTYIQLNLYFARNEKDNYKIEPILSEKNSTELKIWRWIYRGGKVIYCRVQKLK